MSELCLVRGPAGLLLPSAQKAKRWPPKVPPNHPAKLPPSRSPQDVLLNRLFPEHSPESLIGLSRSELIQLAQDAPQEQPPHLAQAAAALTPDQGSENDEDREWNEAYVTQDPASGMCDDVNSLSLHANRRSFIGALSVHAVLRAIFKLNPLIQAHAMNSLMTTWYAPSMSTSAGETPTNIELHNTLPTVDEQTSINAYFSHIHSITPLLDETEFRKTWIRGQRSDVPWVVLLNMVMALGSLSTGEPNDQSHGIYFLRAKKFLDLEFLGNGCVESLQTLCLLGGYYLHFKNAPNIAHTIMGAAFRVAIALGLHRETGNTRGQALTFGMNAMPETRRRIWWSLYCLDTWGSMTLGRPTQARWDSETMNVSSSSDLSSLEDCGLSLGYSQAFCRIATKVQHRFAQFSPITTGEIRVFDSEIQAWHARLPSILITPENCPAQLLTAQYFLCNRYFNLRLLIHRPVLLSYAHSLANRNNNRNFGISFPTLQPDEEHIIQNCRKIASAAINQTAIAIEDTNRLRVWNAAWYLYQATLVVLLSIAVDSAHPDCWQWRGSIEKSLALFDRMAQWTKTAERSRLVVASIYEACTLPPDTLETAGEESVRTATMSNESGVTRGMNIDDFDMSVWNSIGLDTFREDWNWNASDWPNGA
ncbi:hypothetical protein V492_02936 [Pseudogymnoascus sp. VKM F-4246]|nr:hypothetical protein V492_02936 [Pseudogymnoascus sp. VKM F-4246]